MDQSIKAPKINNWIQTLRGGELRFDYETRKVIDEIFENLHMLEPCGEDERRELWLKADRGAPEDFYDYEELREDGDVDTYEEFLQMWMEYYPEEVNWFNLVTVEHEDYWAIFLGRKLIYQSRIIEVCENYENYEYNFVDLFRWIREAVKVAIRALSDGNYNEDVNINLSATQRTGTIARKDYWAVYPNIKEDYLSTISEEEICLFVKNIGEQIGEEAVGCYLSEMTADRFYKYCAIGYRANNYENLEGISAKKQYYKMADGRDEGLSEINPYSSEEFEAWYNDSNRFGGHPWEVCRGGNSTHIDLYVRRNDLGYFLALRGKAWTRSIETIKFYNALRKEGIAVYLCDSEEITDRLLGNDRIGIVPEDVLPAYCESWFPGMKIIDFMNLPCEKEKYELMIPKIIWLPETIQKLKK